MQNGISNTKYCLTRLLYDFGRDPLYSKVTQAKTVKDLCAALQVEYTEKLSDVPSRGEDSASARAADSSSLNSWLLTIVKASQLDGRTDHNTFRTSHDPMRASQLKATDLNDLSHKAVIV